MRLSITFSLRQNAQRPSVKQNVTLPAASCSTANFQSPTCRWADYTSGRSWRHLPRQVHLVGVNASADGSIGTATGIAWGHFGTGRTRGRLGAIGAGTRDVIGAWSEVSSSPTKHMLKVCASSNLLLIFTFMDKKMFNLTISFLMAVMQTAFWVSFTSIA